MKVELVKERRIIPNKLDCLKCGVCCFLNHSFGKSFKGITVGEDGWCIYYDNEKKCTIHDKRPTVCRKYVSGGKECLLCRKRYLDKMEKE